MELPDPKKFAEWLGNVAKNLPFLARFSLWAGTFTFIGWALSKVFLGGSALVIDIIRWTS
jgi:hypothetical protein|tara:strand:- start:27482 stop:27661 length:180 start_codon:yes stop_codon:yes gene_type:complete